eukprot:Skav214058  [mRNA]  locus=scaffold2017:612310:612795:- [translate_table: standard]
MKLELRCACFTFRETRCLLAFVASQWVFFSVVDPIEANHLANPMAAGSTEGGTRTFSTGGGVNAELRANEASKASPRASWAMTQHCCPPEGTAQFFYRTKSPSALRINIRRIDVTRCTCSLEECFAMTITPISDLKRSPSCMVSTCGAIEIASVVGKTCKN